MSNNHVQERVAVVTGASSGIGAATARALARTARPIVMQVSPVPMSRGVRTAHPAARGAG